MGENRRMDGHGRLGRRRTQQLDLCATRHAQSHEWARADMLDALRNDPRVDGLPDQEVISAIDSAYRGKL
jgi:hypothetical protein